MNFLNYESSSGVEVSGETDTLLRVLGQRMSH